MQLTELERIMQPIKNNLELFKANQKYRGVYFLKLANGDEIKIFFPETSVPHLLGVNTNYLISTSIYGEKSSFKLLEKMSSDYFSLYRNINNGVINEKNLFSDHVDKKNHAFSQNLKVNIYDMMFACPYDKSKSYVTGGETYNFDYVLVTKSPDEEGIFMLGLVQNENGYVPMSNQYFASLEEAKERFRLIFHNQVITIPTKLDYVSTNNDSKFYLHGYQKFEKIKVAKSIANMSSATLDVSDDYKWLLTKYYESMNQGGFVKKDFANIINEHIESGKIITPESFDLPNFMTVNEYLLSIINAHNDFVSTNLRLDNNTDDSNVETYTSLAAEVESLRKIKEDLILANEKLIAANAELTNENENLKAINSDNENRINSALKILTK